MSTQDEIKAVVPATRWNQDFVNVANGLRPKLHRWTRSALRTIRFMTDQESFFGLRSQIVIPKISDFESRSWGTGEDFILDFGIHMVGYLSMSLTFKGVQMDAPCRLRLTFGESPLDVTMGMEGVKTWISTSWLPDEIVNIDILPSTLQIPRRHAFRYLRIEVLATSSKYKVSFSNVRCECVSAIAQERELELYNFESSVLRSIDHVSISTLRDCMQSVYEDGPRRDRRLWLGDLRLQALASYATFKDFNLVKRCIYQFAAVTRQDGSVPASIFNEPELAPSTDYIVDYDALFAALVNDYVIASGDLQAGHELWLIVLDCLKRPLSHLDPSTWAFDGSLGEGFKFLDWQKELHRDASCHGLLLYCLKAANNLAGLLQKSPSFETEVSRMTEGAKKFLDDDGVFISGPVSQKSYASAAWLTLSGAFSPDVARSALLKTLADPTAIRPLTPYLWHYVCDALATAGCYDQCTEILTEYWGGMLKAGADTFWEAFDPKDPQASPYGDVRNNSFCHAWSCTPSYLLRGKLLHNVLGRNSNVATKVTMEELDQRWISRT